MAQAKAGDSDRVKELEETVEKLREELGKRGPAEEYQMVDKSDDEKSEQKSEEKSE